jgi:chorismate-pyruvate lyase
MRRASRTHAETVQNARLIQHPPPAAAAPPPRGAGGSVVPLDPLLRRAVLATDGTVTNLIESLLERVVIEKLGCEQLVAPLAAWPDLLAGTAVLHRTVLIRGAESRRIFLHAESLLVLECLDPAIREELLGTDKPIGKLIREYKLESYRELLGSAGEPAGLLAPVLGVDAAEPLIARTYRIHIGGRPAIQITERFLARDASEA